jgi:serine/threonine protein kinase
MERLRKAEAVEQPVLTKKQVRESSELAFRVKQEKLGASVAQLTPFQIQRKALQVSMSSILQYILESSDSEQCVFNILLVSKDIHAAVTKTTVFSQLVAEMVNNADFQRILREFELSRRLDGPEPAEVYESCRKIPVMFPDCTQERIEALTAVIGKDIVDSLSNLGDGMPFIEQFSFIGKGSYGSVWAAPDTLATKSAWKVIHQAGPLWALPKAACNEFTMNAISQLVSRRGKATRQTLLPFAIGPIDTPGHPMFGKQCFALPSKEKQGMFYPVLVKRQAQGTLLGELRELSKLFNYRNGKAPPGALSRVAGMMECALEAVNNMHMYAGTHRDIKADNFLLEDCRPDSQGKFMRTHSNKKVKVFVGDLGLSIPHGVQTYCDKQRTFAGAGKPSSYKRAARQLEKDAGVSLGRDNTGIQKAHAATEAKLKEPSALATALETALKVQGGKEDAPVLMEVQLRALHLLTGAFPSHGQPDDPPPPPQYASGWGTHLYSPPEKNPKLPPDAEYADSRSYRAGDMWAMGAMLSEMVKGNGLKVAYHPDDSHGKHLFATCYDGVFWRQHLNKLGHNVPDEWQQCVSLIRNLCASKPDDRLTASDALQHEFLHAARS